MAGIRLLIAEDNTLMRRLLVEHLGSEHDFEVVGEARNGREAVDLASRYRPDIILMDLDMPLLNGAEATERIKSQHSDINIVMLTAHHGLTGLGKVAGAFSAMVKDTTPQEIAAEIRRAQSAKRERRTAQAPDNDYNTLIEVIAVRHGLTELETTVLKRTVALEITLEQIAGTLVKKSGKPVTVSSVKHTVQRIMTKLHVEPRTRGALVKYVFESGS